MHNASLHNVYVKIFPSDLIRRHKVIPKSASEQHSADSERQNIPVVVTAYAFTDNLTSGALRIFFFFF